MDRDSDFDDRTHHALVRLATLQRMEQLAREGNRAAMLDAIQEMMHAETQLLRKRCGRDAEAHSDNASA